MPRVCAGRPARPLPFPLTHNLAGTTSVSQSIGLSVSIGRSVGLVPGPGLARQSAGVNNMRPRAESDVDGHRFFPAPDDFRTATERARERRHGRVTEEKAEGNEILPHDTAAEWP